ncbi:hypothetical protein SAMN04487969_11952 [Paenibacillus algorifonticola]|uniref:Uncharacterized protein n=1 Tax=Paenibacillus algorifonticola TaxID=684063 RepID=A0A1I2H011_9BACL|nr:hypothetical protein [Paenibacillus algorifonticola]SFF22868.1 hypothetical protein SAMN04487969_11952 [Paenibacillus algorifonticola]
MSELVSGIMSNMLYPIIIWIIAPGLLGVVLLKRVFRRPEGAFYFGSGVGVILIFSIGPWSAFL